MPVRTAHGSAKKAGRVVVVEGTPADEIHDASSVRASEADAAHASASGLALVTRGDASAARALQKRSAAARARNRERIRALARLGLRGVQAPALRPFLQDAEEWVTLEGDRLRRLLGGGTDLPPNVGAILVQAGIAMAGSRAAASAGELELAAKLGAEVRAQILAAHSLAVLEAKARAAHAPTVEEW